MPNIRHNVPKFASQSQKIVPNIRHNLSKVAHFVPNIRHKVKKLCLILGTIQKIVPNIRHNVPKVASHVTKSGDAPLTQTCANQTQWHH